MGGGGGCHVFITLQFNHIYCVGKIRLQGYIYYFSDLQSFELPCKILIQVFIVLKPDIIWTFLIHSGSLQKNKKKQKQKKIVTALFDFVRNTQKRKLTIFLSA